MNLTQIEYFFVNFYFPKFGSNMRLYAKTEYKKTTHDKKNKAAKNTTSYST